MIVADKRVLKANLEKGSIAIQYKLIYLYSQNLNALATISELIAGLAMVALMETEYSTGEIPDSVFGYIYYFFAAVCLIAALLAYTTAGVEIVWGPIMALSGNNQQEVREATRHMRSQQNDSFFWGTGAIVTLFIGTWVFELAQSGYYVGIVVTIVLAVALFFIIYEGRRAYDMFDINKRARDTKLVEVNEEKDDEEEAKSTKHFSGKSVVNAANVIISGSVSNLKSKSEERYKKTRDKLHALEEKLASIKGRGIVWSKSLYVQERKEQSDCFHKCFAVVENGKLDLYTDEEAFNLHRNSCNSTPFKLHEYELETNTRKLSSISSGKLSATSALRGALLGNQEISFQDAISADFDVQAAAQKYKFSLLPKVSSELSLREALHFMAEDEIDYSQWLKVLRVVIATLDEIEAIKESDFMETGGASDQAVKYAVKSAYEKRL
mmetsp:Transcript_24793/g.36570  ORF Transcript_24793/g.36570 Transcript_24793/m.36570 type:complete len:439 (+) Transcript_24793:80-1396(+)